MPKYHRILGMEKPRLLRVCRIGLPEQAKLQETRQRPPQVDVAQNYEWWSSVEVGKEDKCQVADQSSSGREEVACRSITGFWEVSRRGQFFRYVAAKSLYWDCLGMAVTRHIFGGFVLWTRRRRRRSSPTQACL
ncbi:unnamed protein product [Gongylonema pulchrum]|uniref:Uncharacterized protein n=1 Tax=Gongylonema pulchrum TaxID=637853 RepID=A0A183EIB8_9BILA|nr:unnamed protein product [Gongylonema pulchrum]